MPVSSLRPPTTESSFCSRWPVAVLCLLLVPAWGLAAQDDVPNFSGTWQLNEELSTSPREAARGGNGRRGGGGFSVGGVRGGLGGGGGRGGGPPAGGQRGQEDARQQMQERLAALKTLTIVHLEPELLMQDANGQETVLFTDERVFERQGLRGRPQEMRGRWKRDSLRFETVSASYGPGQEDAEKELEQQANPFRRRQGQDQETIETWQWLAETDQLVITLERQGDGRRSGRKLERVYDRLEVDPESSAEPAALKGTLVPLETEIPASEGG